MDFYLHVGTGKTGTSAIQSFFNKNRKQLIQNFSCLYPNLELKLLPHYFSGNCTNHCGFFRVNDTKFIETNLLKLIKVAKAKNIKKIVISCEGLVIRREMPRLLRKIITPSPEHRVFIIIYIRRQDLWLESAWKQWGVKDKRFENETDFLAKWKKVHPYNINPIEFVEFWAKEFGEQNIIIQPYEKEQLPEGIIVDFLNKIEVDYKEIQDFDPKRDKYYVNVGFNRDIIEIFNLNKGFYRNIHDNRLIRFFTTYLNNDYKKAPFDEYSIFSPQQRLMILEDFFPQYEIIAKKYLSRPNGRMFFEALPDPSQPWNPYGGLTVDKIVPIFMDIIYNMEMKNQNRIKRSAPHTVKQRIRQALTRIGIKI